LKSGKEIHLTEKKCKLQSDNFHFFFENIQYAQKRKERRKKVLEIIKKSQKLSTSKNVEISKKRSYTPSYTHYPQKKGEKYRFT
jgi:hypothetical protein